METRARHSLKTECVLKKQLCNDEGSLIHALSGILEPIIIRILQYSIQQPLILVEVLLIAKVGVQSTNVGGDKKLKDRDRHSVGVAWSQVGNIDNRDASDDARTF